LANLEVEEIVGGFTFTWQAEKITIKVTRLRLHNSDSRVTGVIQIINSLNGLTIYPQTSLNFTAERSRTQLAKSLSDEDNRCDWNTLIKALSKIVIERAWAGEPVRELWTHAADVKPPEYLLYPILVKGLPTVIFGEKGAAKSTLALAFYLCLTFGWQDNPLELTVPERAIKTLILDWETEGEITQYYGKRLIDGSNAKLPEAKRLPSVPVYHRRCSLPLADDLEQTQEWIAKIRAEVTIIDSLGAAAGGELNKPETALRFFAALRQLKTTSLILAQTSKDEDSKKKSIFGSTYFTYYTRNVWELCKGESGNEDDLDLALFHRHGNISKPHPPLSFHLHYNETGLTIEWQPFNLDEFLTKVNQLTQVLSTLKSGSLSVQEIVAKTGLKISQVSRALNNLQTKGQVVSLDRGNWGLISHET